MWCLGLPEVHIWWVEIPSPPLSRLSCAEPSSRQTSDLACPTRIKEVGRLFRYFFADEAIATPRFCFIEQLVKLLNHVFKNNFNARSAIKYACTHQDAFGEIRDSFGLASETILNGAESTYGFIGQLRGNGDNKFVAAKSCGKCLIS